jgi:membrane protein required for beta-lactamase induction
MTGAALANQVKELLNWLPVRLEAFLFALGGHFTAVFACWKRSLLRGPDANDQLLVECGIAALDVFESQQLPETGTIERDALALIDRALIIGLVLLAMIVLLG